MAAVGALHSHPDADPDKASERVNQLWYDVIGSMPYLTGGKTGEEAMHEERMGAVERYQEMRRRTLKE